MSFFKAAEITQSLPAARALDEQPACDQRLLLGWCNAVHVCCPQLSGALNVHSCSHVTQSKRIWSSYEVVLDPPYVFMVLWCVYIDAFSNVHYFKHAQILMALTVYTQICVALVQFAWWTSNECWRTNNALVKNNKFSVCGSWFDYVWLSLTSRKYLKMTALSVHIEKMCAEFMIILYVLTSFPQINISNMHN